jgi:hypothetical protein
MPIKGPAFEKLKTDIKAAFKATMDTGYSTGNEQSTANAETAIETLGNAIGTAIHTYALQADVNIGAVISSQAPGVMVLTVGSPFSHIGSTVMPIVTMHAGFGKLQ